MSCKAKHEQTLKFVYHMSVKKCKILMEMLQSEELGTCNKKNYTIKKNLTQRRNDWRLQASPRFK